MDKLSLLQQVRGSATHLEALNENNISKVAEAGLTFSEVANRFDKAGLDAGKIIIDSSREIYNAFYADFDIGLYFVVFLQRSYLEDFEHGPEMYIIAHKQQNYLKKRDWKAFYMICVPTALQIWDFQKRYKDIEADKIFEVWAQIHTHLDYANGQWDYSVLDYVFKYAPEPKNLPLNENGMVEIYRGSGSESEIAGIALSWSTNKINALWFANHTGLGEAVYKAEVAPEDVVVYFGSFREEHEVIVRPGRVKNIKRLDMIPVNKENIMRLVIPAFSDIGKYGKYVNSFGYESESVFTFHGKNHIYRVLVLALIMYYNGNFNLIERDKNVLIYFALLHDIGRVNEEIDPEHGAKSVRQIMMRKITIPDLDLPDTWRGVAKQIIRYHSLPDKEGYKNIIGMKGLSGKDRERVKLLYDICKDADALDRVRFNGLDYSMLRTNIARRLPLIAGALLNENIETLVNEINALSSNTKKTCCECCYLRRNGNENRWYCNCGSSDNYLKDVTKEDIIDCEDFEL